MSLQDPLADMLTSIRNAQQARRSAVTVPDSKIKRAVCEVLEEQGYIDGVERKKGPTGHSVLEITLRYHNGEGAIRMLRRVSRPGLRSYQSCKTLPQVYRGLGIAILTTSKGVMSDSKARAANLGGEVICTVF